MQTEDATDSKTTDVDTEPLAPQPARKRMRRGTRALIVVTVLSVVAIGAMWLLTPRKYMATGAVRVLSPTPSNPMGFGNAPQVPLELMNRYVADQMFFFNQGDFFAEAIKDSEVRVTHWYRSEPDPERLLEELKSDLDVRQAPDASAFTISFSTSDATDSKVIVERLIELYLRQAESDSKTTYMSQLNGTYQTQLADLKKKRENIEQAKRALAGATSGVTGLAEGKNVESEKLRGLLAESARAEADLALVRSQWEELRNTDEFQLEPTREVMAFMDSNPEVVELKQEIRKAKRAFANLKQQEEPSPEETRAMEIQISGLEAEMSDLTKEKIRTWLTLQKAQAERAYRNATDVVLSLREQIADEQAKARDADTKLIQFQQLSDEQKRLDEQIAKLSDVVNQLQLMVNNDAERTRVQWMIHPVEATRPTLDYRIQLLTSATYVLLAVPAVFAVVLAGVRIVRWASRLGYTIWVEPPQP